MDTNRYGNVSVVCDDCSTLCCTPPEKAGGPCEGCGSDNTRQIPTAEAEALMRQAFSGAKMR